MKKIYMLTGFMAIALVLVPAVSSANTYRFVDTSGNLRTVEANSFTHALATAHPLAYNSGVWLVARNGSSTIVPPTPPTPIPPITSGTGNYYLFVNTSGNLQGVWAPNSSVALATAYPLAIHGGVWLNPAIQ
jgi:hypothetical protein